MKTYQTVSQSIVSRASGVIDGHGRMEIMRYEPGDATSYRVAYFDVPGILRAGWTRGVDEEAALLIWDGHAMAVPGVGFDLSYLEEKLNVTRHVARIVKAFLLYVRNGIDGDALLTDTVEGVVCRTPYHGLRIDSGVDVFEPRAGVELREGQRVRFRRVRDVMALGPVDVVEVLS